MFFENKAINHGNQILDLEQENQCMYLFSFIKSRRETSICFSKCKSFTSIAGSFNSVSRTACTCIVLCFAFKNLFEAIQLSVIIPLPTCIILSGLTQYKNLCKRFQAITDGYWTKQIYKILDNLTILNFRKTCDEQSKFRTECFLMQKFNLNVF